MAILHAATARAEVEGQAPQSVGSWRVFGNHSATGAALMAPGQVLAEVNSVLLSGSTGEINDIPFDGEVTAAFLFWSGSAPRSSRSGPPNPPDRTVDFTLADGTFYDDLSVDTDPTGFGRCVTVSRLGGFYYCRRDVTELLQQQGPGNANGIYRVGDVEADPGLLDPDDPQWPYAQAKYANWSLLVVWEADSEPVRRDVVLYDGYLFLDETDDAPGIHSFNVSDFVVGSPALGRLTLFGMEGDRQLGVPPQDSSGCATCFDFASFRSSSFTSATKLANGSNPANNSLNSSWRGQPSTDIDTYSLDGLINTGDQTAQITVGSGDGAVPGGDGESWFLGWMIMTVDTLTPNFARSQTKKTVDTLSAGGGQRLYYTIDVVNEGSADANDVVVTDTIPDGTRYVPNSTRVDGAPVADNGDTSPLVDGLSLGTVPHRNSGDNSRQVTFEVVIEDDACGGTVTNAATVSSRETDPVTIESGATLVEAADLGSPTKAVSFFSGQLPGPGAAFSYTIDVPNESGQRTGGLQITDPLPEAMVVSNVLVSSPEASWDITDGTLTVTNLAVPAGGSSQVVVSGRVRSVAEFAAIGVPEDAIDGTVVTNQATVSGGCNPAVLTDDPDAGGFQATTFQLQYAPDLSTSAKQVTDINGGPLEPGDTLRYTLRIANTGNRATDVVVTDAIPDGTRYVPASTQLDGSPLADIGGNSPLASGYTISDLAYAGVGDSDREITFDVTVDAAVADGTQISNAADLAVPAYPAADRTLTAPTLEVSAAPELSTSIKRTADLTPPDGTFRPGDRVEYTIEVINSGNRAATDVVVRDPLPDALSFESASGSGGLAGGEVRWPLGSVAAGTTKTVWVRARLDSPLDDGLEVVNRAFIESAELATVTTPPARFSVTSAPELVVTKAVELPQQPPRPGDGVTYRIRIDNNGDMTARDVVVSDPLDPNLVNVLAPSGADTPDGIEWSSASDGRLAAIAPDDPVVELVVLAEVASPLVSGTRIENQASVQSAGGVLELSDDPSTAADADPTAFTVVSEAALAFTKDVEDLSADTAALPGDRVRYVLTLESTGDAPLRDIEVSDTLPPELTRIDAGAQGGRVSGGTVRWTPQQTPALGSIAPNEQVSLSFEATIRSDASDGTRISNQAVAASADLPDGTRRSDGDLGAAGAQPTELRVVSQPALAISKTAELVGDTDGAFNPGDAVRYRLQVANVGTGALTDVRIEDPVPDTLSVTNRGGAALSGTTLRWTEAEVPILGSLLPGNSVALSFTARLDAPLADGTTVSNQASGEAAQLAQPQLSDDPARPGDADATVFQVQSQPVLTASTKTVEDTTGDPLVTTPGDSLVYTITVRNDGNAVANDVTVTDPIAAALSVQPPANASFSGGQLRWDSSTDSRLASLSPTESVTLSFTAAVEPNVAGGTRIDNQATIAASELASPTVTDDPATASVDDPTSVTVAGDVDLGASTMRATDTGGQPLDSVTPGGRVRFVIEVSNRGSAPARDLVVSNPLPEALTVTDASDGSVTNGTVRWDAAAVSELGELAAGDRVLLTYTAEVSADAEPGTDILNQAFVAAAELADPVATDADPSTLTKEPVRLRVRSGYSLTQSTKIFANVGSGAQISQARPDDVVRIVVRVRNTGAAATPELVIEDPIDTDVLTQIVPRDGGSFTGGTLRWQLGAVPPGQERVLRADARIRSPADPGVLENQAGIRTASGETRVLTDDPGQPGPSDPTRLEIIATADLSASIKTVPGLPEREVEPGNTFTYAIEVRNDGDGNARDILLTDVLAPELSFQGASAGASYEAASRTVTWNLPVVRGGASERVTLTVRAAQTAPLGTQVANQARIAATGIDPELTDDPLAGQPDTPTTVTILSRPNLSRFTKSVRNLDAPDGQGARPGDTLEYAFELENTGSAAATQLSVRDPLDTANLGEPQPVDAFRREGNELIFDATTAPALSRIDPGESVTLRFRVPVGSDVAPATLIRNQAVVAAPELEATVLSDADPATPESAEPTEIEVRTPVLELAKSFSDANGAPVAPGDQLSFTLNLTNSGNRTAEQVEVVDPLPSALTVVDAPGADISGQRVSWSVGELAPGASRELRLQVRVPVDTADATRVSNQASASSAHLQPVVSDWPATPEPADPVVFEVVAEPEFASFSKRVETPDAEVNPGDVLRYTLSATNTGAAAAEQLRVVDPLPQELTLVDAESDGQLQGDELIWNVGELPRGESISLSFRARVRNAVSHATVIANQARLSWSGAPEAVLSDDPSTAPSPDPTQVTVSARPDFLASTLRAEDLNGGTVQPGDRIRYTVVARNNGTSPGEQTSLQMPVPPFTSYVPGSTLRNGQAVPDASGSPPFTAGMPLRSARSGSEAGVVVLDDGAAPNDEWATVRFDVRVDPRAAPGSRIAAQARIAARHAPATGTDNPATPLAGDATVMVVGGGFELGATKGAELVEDADEDGQPSVGDTLAYEVRVANVGTAPARAVRLTDPIPQGAEYRPGSLSLDGVALSEPDDGDAGEVTPADEVVVALGDLAPESARRVRFAVTIAAGPALRNQAAVESGGRRILSDGDPGVAGVQPTITGVEGGAVTLAVDLNAQDADGGVLDRGDTLGLDVSVRNVASSAAGEATVSVSTPEGVALQATDLPETVGAEQVAPGRWNVNGLGAGERVHLPARALIGDEVQPGSVISVNAAAELGEQRFAAEPAQLVVGAGAGSAQLRGQAFWDGGEPSEQLQQGEDEPLEGFSVFALPADTPAEVGRDLGRMRDAAVAAGLTRRDGSYAVRNLPAGRYVLWVVSPQGTVYAQSDALTLEPGSSRSQNFAVDPSGIIYTVGEGVAQPVGGARVFLVDAESGQRLPRAALLGGQQGQVTTNQGFYRFDVRSGYLPGEFAVQVEPPSARLLFPSDVRPPSGASDDAPLGRPADPGPDGRVVPNDFPDPGGDTTYFLRFNLDVDSPNITNNHIPLDRLDERLRLTKTVSRRTASVGDILTYTINISNPTEHAVPLSEGGVSVLDDLPRNVRWIDGQASLQARIGDDVVLARSLDAATRVSGRTVRLGPFALRRGATMRIRYQAVVGLEAEGVQVNRARLMQSGVQLSDIAEAAVRIVRDPIFTEGTVLGRVFCDTNADGELDAGEQGMPGARVYLDTGFVVDSDAAGKFHFRGVPPGRHAVKIDPNSLPPGARVTTERLHTFLLTEGLLEKVRFGVTCPLESTRPEAVTFSERPAGPPKPEAVVTFEPELPALALDGEPQPLPLVDAVVAPANAEADFGDDVLQLDAVGTLTWHIKRPLQLEYERWEIALFEYEPQAPASAGTEVWRARGDGRPPKRFTWEQNAEQTPLEPGKVYVYRIAAVTENGDLGEGRWRKLAVAERSSDKGGEQLALWRGELFGGSDSTKPTQQLREKVAALAAELQDGARDLIVETHVAGGGPRTANLIRSQRQAVAIKTLLTEAGIGEGRIKAQGKGDMQPIMPNISRRGRQMNRRVVVRAAAAPKRRSLAPLSYPGWLRVNEQDVSPTGRKEIILPVEPETEVVVDYRAPSGQRVRLARSYPFEAPATSEVERVEVDISGSVNAGSFEVAGESVSVPLLESQCGPEAESHPLEQGSLAEPVEFSLQTPVEVRQWLVRVYNPEGPVLTDLQARAENQSVKWTGKNPSGTSVVRSGAYTYRCMVTDASGNRLVTARKPLWLGDAEPEANEPLYESVLRGAEYPDADGLQPAAREALTAAAERLRGKQGATLHVEVHDDSSGGRFQAQIRTARLVKVLKEFLLEQGVDAAAVELTAHGANKPLMPGATQRAKQMNRRVRLEVVAPPETQSDADSEPHVRVNGTSLALRDEGRFSGTLTVETDATLSVDLALASGRSMVFHVPLFAGKPLSAAATEQSLPQTGPPPQDSERLGSSPDSIAPASPAPGAAKTPSASRATTGGAVALASGKPARDSAAAAANAAEPHAEANTPAAAKPPSTAQSSAADAQSSAAAAATPEAIAGKAASEAGEAADGETAAAGQDDSETAATTGAAPGSRPAAPPDAASAAAPEREEPSADDGTATPAPSPEAEKERVTAEVVRLPGAQAQTEAGPATVPIAEAPEVPAANLRVSLPPDGATLRGERLPISGKTAAQNQIRINGETVDVDAEGRFMTVLTLPAGEATVEISSTDAEGREARIKRTYQVPQGEWFLLGLADAVGGYGERLPGMNEHTTLPLGNDWYLHGRAVAYFKGRLQGSALFEDNPFETLRLTAHVDSGKRRQLTINRRLIDTERFYPTYGDSALEVQEATSRYKAFMELEADNSRLIVGNFKTRFRPLELFQYDRTFFGGSLDLQHEFVEDQVTEVHAIAATGQAGVRHRQLSLQGTGGFLFFLKDRALIEGSERVRIVVRDQVSGTRLLTEPMQRIEDYRIDYQQGRITLKKPLPATVTAGWHLNRNPTRAMQGNPVFLEVEYDYDAAQTNSNEEAFGIQVRHSIGDRVTVGAVAVDEDRSVEGVGRYRLFGGEARVRLVGRTRLDAEVAYSQSEDAKHFASFDGGVTYGRIGIAAADPSRAGDAEGWAARLQVAGDVGDFFPQAASGPNEQSRAASPAEANEQAQAEAKGGTSSDSEAAASGLTEDAARGTPGRQSGRVATPRTSSGGRAQQGPVAEGPAAQQALSTAAALMPAGEQPAPSRAGRGEWIPFSLYVQHQDPGFYTGGTVFEQGQTKLGGEARWVLSPKDTLRLRHDGVWSRLRVEGEERLANRQLTTAGYERREESWTAGFEAGHTYLDNEGQQPVQVGLFDLYGEMNLLPGLVGFAEQEGVAGGDARVVQSTLDRFATTVGGHYRLSERIWLSLTETVRWSGTNSTQLGLKTQVVDGLNVYASERLFGGGDQKLVSTTVVGAENTLVPGSRSYAEYQLDAMTGGTTGRAVFGMDNQWTVAEGLTLTLSYERAQKLGVRDSVFAGPSGSALANSPSALGAGAGALNGQGQFSASSFSSAGVFPLGVSSRDAFAAGVEFLRQETLKGGANFEIRYDRVDDRVEQGVLPHDRLVYHGNVGADWQFHDHLVMLGRAEGASIHNMDVQVEGQPAVEGQYLDLSLGVAFRPVEWDTFEALLKWTRRYERNAVNPRRTQYQLQVADVASFEPALELGWGFQLVGKAAVKNQEVYDAELDPTRSITMLALGRLNYHIWEMFDAAVEYRWRTNTLAQQSEHGALVELAWLPVRYVSVGVGYNFTDFDDDLLRDPNDDDHGFFMRVTGRY